MVTRTAGPVQRRAGADGPGGGDGDARWQAAMREAVTCPRELLTLLDIDPDAPGLGLDPDSPFRLRVPRAFVRRMRRGDRHDPLLRQVLPLAVEHAPAAGFGPDPVGDRASLAAPGVLHKYHGRALLIASAACGVHCRYCFRRHFPYTDAAATPDTRPETLAWLRADASISEVILSGGDPLTLTDRRLAGLVADLERIPHLARLRIHTRQPVVIPERVTPALCALLGATRLDCVVVVHVNHPNEIDGSVRDALRALKRTGATLLNQSVLLRGVNDDPDTLAALSERLFGAGVLPYYLHRLDPVAGAAHFDLPVARARALHRALRERLPGYLVPRLVEEIPGAPAKSPL